eukprot:Em0006g600a
MIFELFMHNQPLVLLKPRILKRPPVLKSVGTVTGLKNGSITFQIGDTSSPPPYPRDTLSFTIAGSGSLSAAQIQYSHPNMTLTGLTEDNIGSYMLTATNRRLISNTIIGSSTGTFNLTVLFPPVITSGPSLVAAVLGQPATLVCSTNLRSDPPSSILWRNNNETTLTTGGRYVFGNGSDNVYIMVSNTNTSDNGTWSCVLNNGVFGPLTVNIVLFIVVPPSQPNNVTSNDVSDNTTQLYISWQPPYSMGVPPVSVYMVTASSLDSTNRIVLANTTAALFTQLWPGMSYDITVVAISGFGGASAVGPASDKETFSTEPNAPTLMCRDLIATAGTVNVSWTVVYNGIPIRPDEPQIISTKPGTITLTLSTAASGSGATGSFAFIISSVPSIDTMPSTYSFPAYIDGQKVSIIINNIKEATQKSASSSIAGPVAGGVIGGIVFVLVILIVLPVVIYLALRHRVHKMNQNAVQMEQNSAYGMVHGEDANQIVIIVARAHTFHTTLNISGLGIANNSRF